jgi:hypothetical protein
MAKRPSIRWKGDLARPIRWSGPTAKRVMPSVAIPEPSDEAQAENARLYERALLDVFAESIRKLERLKELFEIPPGPIGDRLLALRLAMEFVPGFKLSASWGGRGRPRSKWTDGACIGLIIDVEEVKHKTGTVSDLDALVALVRERNEYNGNNPPKTKGTRRKLALTLQARLTEARKRISHRRLAGWLNLETGGLTRQLFRPGSPLRRANFN